MATNAVHLSYLQSTPILHSGSCSLAKPQRVSWSFCGQCSSLPNLRRHVRRVHSSDVQESDGKRSHTHSSEGCPQCFRWTIDLILQCEDAHPKLLCKGFWILLHINVYPFLVLLKNVILLFNQMGLGEILFEFILLFLFYLFCVLNL